MGAARLLAPGGVPFPRPRDGGTRILGHRADKVQDEGRTAFAFQGFLKLGSEVAAYGICLLTRPHNHIGDPQSRLMYPSI